MINWLLDFLGITERPFSKPDLKDVRKLFIYTGQDQKMRGSGNWGNCQRLYLDQFTKQNEALIARVSLMDPKVSYTNLKGRECWPYIECGTLKIVNNTATMTIRPTRTEEQEFICTAVYSTDEKGNPRIVLDFSAVSPKITQINE